MGLARMALYLPQLVFADSRQIGIPTILYEESYTRCTSGILAYRDMVHFHNPN